MSQAILSKAQYNAGSICPLPLAKFGNAAFVLSQTSSAAVARYAALRALGSSPGQAFISAFVSDFASFFIAPETTDLIAAGTYYESGLAIAAAQTADGTLNGKYTTAKATVAATPSFVALVAAWTAGPQTTAKPTPSVGAWLSAFATAVPGVDPGVGSAILDAQGL